MDIPRETLLGLYRTMVTIRAFEERALEEVTARRTFGGAHSSVGQEAVPTGICAHLSAADYLASTHRGHGHCIAKGVDPKRMMAELFGRVDGTNKGKGGSMHIADVSTGMLGANGVVGASVPLACGAALKTKVKGGAEVAVAFFGDGGSSQGIIHESMNLASIWKLPVIFVCENNLYAESTPVEYSVSVENVADRAAGYSMPGLIADGMDVFHVYELAAQAVQRARDGLGPTLLECKTYRYYGHYAADNPKQYRTEEEESYWRSRDPIQGFRTRALEERLLPAEDLDAVDAAVDELIELAVQFAEESPLPAPDELFTDVYADYPLEALMAGLRVKA